MNKICRLCKKDIPASHGNRKYHEDCAYEAKKKRSIWQYSKNKLKADLYWANDSILKDLFYTYGEKYEIDPDLLEKAGFNLELFSKEIDIEGFKVFVMNKFGFALLQNGKVIIWKI